MNYERLRNMREDNDYTQTQIAQLLNISQRTYSHYENNDRSIPIEILDKLADFYDTSVDYLLSRTNTSRPYPKNK